MKPQEVVTRLMEMRTEIKRMMPHINCGPVPCFGNCNCYKQGLLAAIIRAEMKARTDLGMPPF
jgi:hypothetical protein